ncbi:N-formylglutamate amidohydrolase [Mesorhizobium sp.]|uniref:N-formylglutamate amidohydrolase n=2 Tax=unclassified Mesorhizobium TaxID=325217 RepID=UPI000FE402E7|nr:N-formylglutamate amidohydrolase [Mesorhizobium sp.]RWA66896.1 MAG: N-formylglutamate amidohydrolase [Mesorhizobium sp.]RWB96117.1 MAG: N-formylglutamate amidohydrolase [Mesorhizobium sp.]RWG81379.1 MAG: N-formylglutamate amidohydrolase [Mesorhizobium sp.]RWG86841.1 MAG: N-formylglutamate amidohydrolase [Mesorhizobium sp.]RWK09416.1 MAG: N-formylglutamate amidohydrolase [Mesorhizobium sp.]
MEKARPASLAPSETVRVTNPGGSSPFVLTCDHASNFLPAEFGTLGLPVEDLSRHIAWDPGALPVASRMADALDATLVETRISRLVIDCNRPLDAPDLVPPVSETTAIPGNTDLSDKQRAARIDLAWRPFHDTIAGIIEQRLARGQETRLVSVHSFTPVYKGRSRPWHIGIIHDDDRRLAAPLIAALQRLAGITVGVNEPYSPADRVYFTLERHARSRGLACAMIEIRNDEISGETGQRKWADLLTGIFSNLEPEEARGSRQRAMGKSIQSAS